MIEKEYVHLESAIENLATAQTKTTSKLALFYIEEAMKDIANSCAGYKVKGAKSHKMPKGMSTTQGKL